MKSHRLYITIFLSLFFQVLANYANANDKTTFFNQQWLKCVVSIENRVNDKEIKPIGTGFLVASQNDHMLLVPCLINSVRDFGNLTYEISGVLMPPRLKVLFA